jgi:hypothetical protein
MGVSGCGVKARVLRLELLYIYIFNEKKKKKHFYEKRKGKATDIL